MSPKIKPTVIVKSDNNKALLGTDVEGSSVKVDYYASLGWLVGNKRRE